MCFPVNFPKFLRTPFLQNKVAASRITGPLSRQNLGKICCFCSNSIKYYIQQNLITFENKNKIHHHFLLELSVNKRKQLS